MHKERPGIGSCSHESNSGFSWFYVKENNPYKTKAPTFQSRLPCFFPLIIKRWLQSCDLHTRCLTNRFVCNFLSSSAGFNLCSCFFRLTLVFWLSLSDFSGPSVPRPSAASLPLSDPRCFRLLSLASVLGSDYSASVSSFPSLPVSASQWLPQCPSPLSLPRFPRSFPPDLSCVLSRFSYSASCLFPFALPRFAPTAVPRVLTLCFRFRSFPLPFRFLSSPLLSSSVGPVSMPSFRFRYSASCSSFLRFAVSPHSGYLSASAFRSLFRPRPP